MRLSLLALLAVSPNALALEGMYLPSDMANLEKEVTELGFELDPALLSDLDGKILGSSVTMGYCSGAFVSPDGLIATAYHCVTDGLQHASRSGEDLFENGFHARSRAEERWSGPGEHIRVTTKMEDVTEQVKAGTKRLTGEERQTKVQQNITKLESRCEASGGVHCEVAVYGGGLKYQLITQIDLQDVRLVYAPPNSVGYFGEDADNWRWPRHSGDFAFLRAYTAPNGSTASNHPDNVPYKPKHYLETAPQGPAPGEFVGVAGYPDGTYRWRTAAELDYHASEAAPRALAMRTKVEEILVEHSERSAEVATKVAPRILNTSNDIVYIQGSIDGFHRLGTVASKWEFEQDLKQWLAADAVRLQTYGPALDRVTRIQAEQAATGARDDTLKRFKADAQLFQAAITLYRLNVEAKKADRDRAPGFQNRDRPAIANKLDSIDATFDWRVDRDITRYFLLQLLELAPGQRPPALDTWFENLPHKGTREQIIDQELELLYKNSDLMDPNKRRTLMDTSEWYLLKGDNPWFKLAAALAPAYNTADESARRRDAQWSEVRPTYVKAIQEFIPEGRPRYIASEGVFAPGLYYPDTNGTLRVTVGKVDGYYPRDGLVAEPRSRLQGIAEKAGPAPFDINDSLANAIADGKWGRYTDDDLGSVSVNYLSTADTARGSSGSATFDKKGRYSGILFDGNYEAIASDWNYSEGLTRSIHTDISYILWYLDRVSGAEELLTELGMEAEFTDGGAADAAE